MIEPLMIFSIVIISVLVVYRQVIEKKKYKEIADMLNISVKAVEKRMHQALVVMRTEIGKV